ncbi:LysR family transcriptional regulator [Streptomyces sp. LN699]|uniref:LysR family transcriptional regulator n=1 Tax=Streptomyces sp. LN699 TaxID=3112981 RepID=UPI003723D9DF
MIDVQRLRVLRAVAEHGSFNKAAGALLLTPSAVSQHIATLERGLGHPVVVRGSRGITLTEPGRLLTEAAESIFAELDRVRNAIERLSAPRPRLTVATFTSGGRHLLPAALPRFVAAHPEVELTVREAEPEAALPMVRDGAADLALGYHFDEPLPVRPGVDWSPLMDDPLWVVLPPDHPHAGRDSIALAELTDARWVLGCLRTEAYLRRYAQRSGFEIRISASTTDYFFAQSLVAAGVGVSLVPQVALLSPLDAPRPGPAAPSGAPVAVRIEPPRPVRHLGLATARRRDARPYLDTLTAALRDAAKEPRTRASPKSCCAPWSPRTA